MAYVKSLDAGFFQDRLQYSWIDNPAEKRGTGEDRDVKDTGVFSLVNDAAVATKVSAIAIDGPFRLAGPSPVGATIPAGGALDVTVVFDRALFDAPTGTVGAINTAPAVSSGAVTVRTSAGETLKMDLSLIWQPISEGGFEPNLNEIWEAFGFSNHIEGLTTANNGGRDVLDTDGSYIAFDETEILSPYWRIADGYDSFTVTQIGSFTGPSPTNVDIHTPDSLSSLKRLWRVAPNDTQMVLPDRALVDNGEAPATLTLNGGFIPDSWTGDDVFGFRIGRASSDPTLNVVGDYLRTTDGDVWRTFDGSSARNEETGAWKPIDALDLIQQGHWIRSYVAMDKDGRVVPDTYLIAYDYPKGNHDYNDVVLVVQGIAPAADGAAPPVVTPPADSPVETPVAPPPAPEVTGQASYAPDGAPWVISAANGLSLSAPLFDRGGQGVAYFELTSDRVDNSGFRPEESVEYTPDGDAIAYGLAGEWIEYTISVQEAGLYDLSMVTATPINDRLIAASFTQNDATYARAEVTSPLTGSYDRFEASAATPVELRAGTQVLRVLFENGATNLRSIELVKADGSGDSAPQTAFTTDGLPWLVDAQGVALDAILFDQGGEGVAYHDASAGRLDSSGFRPDTSVEFSRTLESVGYTEAGEWLEYTLFVDQAGLYDLSLLTGTNQNGRSLTASFLRGDAAYETAAFTVESTLSFKTFTESAAQIVALEAGEQVLRIAFDNGGVDLSAISLAASDTLL